MNRSNKTLAKEIRLTLKLFILLGLTLTKVGFGFFLDKIANQNYILQIIDSILFIATIFYALYWFIIFFCWVVKNDVYFP